MKRLRRGWHRLRGLLAGQRRERELADEIAAHLEMQTEDNLRAGMPPGEARRAALLKFGAVEGVKARYRDQRGLPFVEETLRDVRYAARGLRRSPGFTVVAVLTLALGIGANSAIFSLVHAVLLRPLPFTDPERLVVVWEDFSARGGPDTSAATPANFTDWRTRNRVFEDMAAVAGWTTFNLTGRGEPERLSGARVTGTLFPMLGLRPVAGRTIEPDDDRPGAPAVAVISEGLWQRRFGADPALIGQSLVLDDVAHTVVGVIPGHFQFPAGGAELWVPAAFPSELLASRSNWYLNVVARLRPGVSLAQAQADMDAIARRLEEEHPETNARLGVTLVPLHEQYAGSARPTLLVLVSTAGVVLLIACANVAHLLLARGAGRRRLIALHAALGAGRARVLRQLLTESLVLAAAGAAAGAALSTVVFRSLAHVIPDTFPESTALALDSTVLLFTAAVAALTSVAIGLGPSLEASRLDLRDALKPPDTIGAPWRDRRVRGALVVAEISMAVVLLVAAGLLVRSYTEVTAVDIGFPVENLLVAETPLTAAAYGEAARRSDLVARVTERVAALPGVVSVGYANYLPLVIKFGKAGFLIDGRPAPQPSDVSTYVAINRTVSAGYLQTLGVPLLSGRYFDERDGAGAPPAVIISESMARTFWGEESPVGQRIRFGPPDTPTPWFTIVGTVGDVRYMGLDAPTEPTLYLPIDQVPSQAPVFLWPRYLVVRTTGDPLRHASSVRAAVTGVDPNQPVADLRSMAQVIDADLGGRRAQLTLVGGFSLLALLLASIGLYGVLAYSVAQHTPEIGLRMALGATRTDVIAPMLRRSLLLSVSGVVLGLTLSALATRALSPFLYEVSPFDPVAFVSVAVLLVVVALVASYAPARRATRIDPLTAIRQE